MKQITFSLATSMLLVSTVTFANEPGQATSIDDSHITNIIAHSDAQPLEFILDMGWDSEYISEGRNNLDHGGIYWGTAAVQYQDLVIYTTVGRGDSETYTEWNFGLEYGFSIVENLEASIGYQRIEAYGDERGSDNELFASLSYSAVEWLTPSMAYTYSTEAGGYFIEASLHSSWPVTEQLTLTPYVTQAFDFQYATEAHNGPNHFQFGIEAEYQTSSNLVLSGHISHTLAQEDIKQEQQGSHDSLDQTYAGIHLTWSF
ncbi:hypothetical protein ACQKE0_13825 [Shewanella colwelliana]|uniref:hypothetical protein n=1 Tax=Shewanella colwelliana TaxID=23 RepID=UPI003CFD304E